MKKISAGLLMYRKEKGELQFLLAHPGGPFYQKKDAGVWSIPKGEPKSETDLLEVAEREFKEETEVDPHGPYIALGEVTQKSGKVVHAWGFEGNADIEKMKSNMFEMEWPPRSEKLQAFPENDRYGFFTRTAAEEKLHPDQLPFLDRLIEKLHE